jgi:excisionase family DNA binding protein
MKPNQNDENRESLMLNTQNVAKLIQCSDRHVSNLRREGRMPAPVKLGQLVRWSRKTIEEWIEAGCPAVEKVA